MEKDWSARFENNSPADWRRRALDTCFFIVLILSSFLRTGWAILVIGT